MRKFMVKELKKHINKKCDCCHNKAEMIIYIKTNNYKSKDYICERCLLNLFAETIKED